jgi:predicted RNA polymerase sigma factor
VRVDPRIEDLLRELAPQVLGTLVRRYGHFDACEDAVQEALLAATLQWAKDGLPDDPRPWLVTVASRRLIDERRISGARRRREETVAVLEPPARTQLPDRDDTLLLLFLCCHPSLSAPSQLALTLRAVGGLTTAEIANAFLVPETTMAQRISLAKKSIRSTAVPFELPPVAERRERLRVVLQVLYLIFNEGYTTSSGPMLQRADLTAEAIRLTRTLHRLMPDEGEVAGLLALMLLTEARRAARADKDGSIVPLAEQQRGLWNAAQIEEGVALVTHPRDDTGWPVPASGCDRCGSRRGAERRRDRLATDPRAVRGARTGIAWTGRHAQSRRCGRHGQRPASRPRSAGHPRRRRPDGA